MIVGNTQLVAGHAGTLPAVISLLQKSGIDTSGNPDVYMRTYKSFGIDEARDVRDRAALRPLGERRVFVLTAADMTREAQNALLKTIEEPPGNALFIFVVQSPETLLPTFRSRTQTLLIEHANQAELVDSAKFISATPERRIEMLKPLLEKGDDEKRDVSAILSFLGSLENAFAKKADVAALEAIYRARKYSTDKGALLKPLLEQVALLVPQI